jgi:hypothetical protein
LSAVLLRPLPVEAPDRLVLFGERQLVGRDADISVAALILLLALAVSLRPAWRAARVDLGTVLKEE